MNSCLLRASYAPAIEHWIIKRASVDRHAAAMEIPLSPPLPPGSLQLAPAFGGYSPFHKAKFMSS